MACTGIEFCKLAVVETKHRARWVIEELERRLPDVAKEELHINLNGCPNSCARFQIADIGLQGALTRVRGPGGNTEVVDGFLVQLGGHLGAGRTFGRKVRGKRVLAEDVPSYVEQVVRRWLDGRRRGESFSDWVWRLSDADLAALDVETARVGS